MPLVLLEEWLLGRIAFALLEPATLMVAVAPWIIMTGASMIQKNSNDNMADYVILLVFTWWGLVFQTIALRVILAEPKWTKYQIIHAKAAALGLISCYGLFFVILSISCCAMLYPQPSIMITSNIFSIPVLSLIISWMVFVLFNLKAQAKLAAKWRLQSARIQNSTTKSSLLDQDQDYEVPRWYSGVNEEQVDALVEECLRDPSINILAIPDVLEGQVYKITISLVLGLIYHLLGQLHGINILAHELRLSRTPNPEHSSQHHEAQLLHMKSALDLTVLERIADRLLENSAVNQPLIPDFIERQLYINCLIIIFRLLDLISTSLTISLCGHDFRLTMQPSSKKTHGHEERDRLQAFAQAAESAVDHMEHEGGSPSTFRAAPMNGFRRGPAMATPINTELLREIAERDHGLDLNSIDNRDDDDDGTVEEKKDHGGGWGWGQAQFEIQLQTTIFSLVLGIVDDLLENTQVELLSEIVQFDIVAAPESSRDSDHHDDDDDHKKDEEDRPESDKDTHHRNEGESLESTRQGPTIFHKLFLLLIGFAAGIAFQMMVQEEQWILVEESSLDAVGNLWKILAEYLVPWMTFFRQHFPTTLQ